MEVESRCVVETVYFVARKRDRLGRSSFSLGTVGEVLPKFWVEVTRRGRRSTRSTHKGLVMSRLRELEEREVRKR